MDSPSDSSPPVDGRRLPQSDFQPATPGPPFDPPHRHSSLGFSQFLRSAEPSPSSSDRQRHVAPQQMACETPSRPLSNIGRKRALVSPLTRSVATPGHVSQMHRIFQDAKASLNLDAAIASSPAGSIASRLPITGRNQDISHHCDTVANMARDWRFSTVPQGLAEIDLDVREPFPVESPGLPDLDMAASGHRQPEAREPMSSGFTSPVIAERNDLVMEDNATLPALPNSSSSKSDKSTTSHLPSSPRGKIPACNTTSTELEQPMTKLHVSHVDLWLNGIQQNSPNTKQEQRRHEEIANSRDSIAHGAGYADIDNKDGPTEIVLSTPAKAAAESAKLKRDLLGGGVRTNNNEENIRPVSRGSHHALRCTTPTANLLSVPTVHVTPSPDFPHGSPPPSPVPPEQLPPPPPFRRVDSTGSPFPVLKGKPPQVGATVPTQQQWQGHYASPPPQQFASPPQQPPTSPPCHQPYHTIYPPPQPYHMGSPPPQHYSFIQSPTFHDRSPPPIPDSQQIIYLHGPPPPPVPRGTSRLAASDRPFYSFSTAAAAHSGSSAAPDSRIRDAYRTDTLTPFEIPTSRFRKIGLGAQTRGARKYCSGTPGDPAAAARQLSRAGTTGPRRPSRTHDPRMGLARAHTGGGARKYYGHGPAAVRSPEEVTFRSSPPRPAGGFQPATAPRRKKMRRSLSGGDGFLASTMEEEGMADVGLEPDEEMVQAPTEENLEEEGNSDDAASSVNAVCGNERVLLSNRNKTQRDDNNANTASWTPARNQKSCRGQGQGRDLDEVEDAEALRELSPYVTPYRKGRGPKGERRPSYWDQDVLPGMSGKKGDRAGGRDGDVDMEYDKENVPPPPPPRRLVGDGDGDEEVEMEIECQDVDVDVDLGVIGAAL